jgi:hypothetical protein
VVEESILLGLVEPVDFIDEQEGSFALKLPLFFGFVDNFADLFDAGEHRREMNEMGLGFAGDDPCQGGFPATRGAPQNHGENPIVSMAWRTRESGPVTASWPKTSASRCGRMRSASG